MDPLQQTALVFVLPIIKAIVQTGVVWFASHVEEYIPGIIVFPVEVFNALYLTKCMQSTKSIVTNVAIILLDVVEMLHAFRDMKGQLSNLDQMQAQYKSDSTHRLLDIVQSVCDEPGVLDPNDCSQIRLRSSMKLQVFTMFTDHGRKQIHQKNIDKYVQDTMIQYYLNNCAYRC